jgi:hypothetical protein
MEPIMSRSPSPLREREHSPTPSAGRLERAVAAADLVRAHIRGIRAVDESDKSQWHVIISLALNGGLSKETLAESFSCNLMTINRWKAGQNAPGPMARKAIKRELIDLLNRLATAYAKSEIEPQLGSA